MDAFTTILSYLAPAAEDRPVADAPVDSECDGNPGSSTGCTVA
jgi:hypothetical protein